MFSRRPRAGTTDAPARGRRLNYSGWSVFGEAAMKHILIYLVLGVTIGGMSGALGIGGGVILVPALIWLLDFDQKAAAGTTLAVLAVPVLVPSVWKYYEQGLIESKHLQAAAWIAVAFAVGS